MVFQIVTPLSIRLGVAGAGTMGSGIALAALLADIPVSLYDLSPGMLDQSKGYIEHHLSRKNKIGNLSRLELSDRLENLSGCNIVIEAAPENLEIKRDLFQQLDIICPPPAVLATNTSTLSITEIAACTSDPQRVVGMHFFNPAPVLPLVEVVQGAQTAPEVLKTAVEVAEKMGKTPVVAKDLPGFIVNRVARPFYGEALRMLGEGTASPTEIDWIVQLGGGFRMGPFQLMDLIGIDVNYAAMVSMYEQTWGEPRYRPHWIQRQMVQQNKLGRKTGQGFYPYQENKAESRAPQLPTRGGNHGQVLLAPGSWAPVISSWLGQSGYTIEPEPEQSTQPICAILPAGKSESLASFVARWDYLLAPEVPFIVQACDVTLSEIATWIGHPQRLVGFDSLFLANGPVATLVSGELTSTEICTRVDHFMQSLGNLPVWIKDTPGLVLPRIVAMLTNEAAFAVMDGVANQEDVDLAMQLGVSYPQGPLAWGKKIGFEHILRILDHLFYEYHEERYRAAPILRRWVRQSQIGISGI